MRMNDILLRFKVIQCLKCTYVQTSSAKEVFKCYNCGRSTQLVKKGNKVITTHFGVRVLFHTESEAEAGDFIRRYKEELKKNEHNDFFSYKPKK